MTYEDLERGLRALVEEAVRLGRVQEREQWRLHQRIGASNDLVRKALELIKAWDSGREWHLQGVVSYEAKRGWEK